MSAELRHYQSDDIHLKDNDRPKAPRSRDTRMNDTAQQIELAEMLARIRYEDEATFSKFYELTVNRVYGLVYKILQDQDDSEEVVSDVYAQIWQQAGNYHPEKGSVIGWMLMIARSRALDLYRKRKTLQQIKDEVQLFLSETGHEGPDSELMIQIAENKGSVSESLKLLSHVQRQLLSLSFFKGLSHMEIAQATGSPIGTVKSHIRRAIIALQEVIKE